LRESTRLALVAAYQVLPARQRAVLLLVEVAAFSPAEVAGILDVSVTAVRSLLQRARLAIASALPDQDRVVAPPDLDTELLRRYLAAFESGDTNGLADLLRADVRYEMPPIARWFSGRAAVLDHHERRAFTRPHKALPTSANGYPALAVYTGDDGGLVPGTRHPPGRAGSRLDHPYRRLPRPGAVPRVRPDDHASPAPRVMAPGYTAAAGRSAVAGSPVRLSSMAAAT
jgi:RNA polymerase sigma-70 factor (ECF subfamily)